MTTNSTEPPPLPHTRVGSALERKPLLRVAIAAALVVAATLALLPREVTSEYGLWAARAAGWFLPGQVLAALLGFLTYNRTVWWISALGAVGATIALLMFWASIDLSPL